MKKYFSAIAIVVLLVGLCLADTGHFGPLEIGVDTSHIGPFESGVDIDQWAGQGLPASGAACSGTYGQATTSSLQVYSFSYGVELRKIVLDCPGTAASVSVSIGDSENDAREVIPVCYEDTGSNHPGALHSNGTAQYGADNGSWESDPSYTPTFAAGTYWCGVVKELSATELWVGSGTNTDGSFQYAAASFAAPADLTGIGTVGSFDYAVKIDF